ncbi:histidine kinase dimerization/phospho-acceptor domain-containing protein, partial [Xanthomonas citri pv. citri]
HRSAARSVIALAAMLAHEIKNPLSGIRGAAQLLEQQASSEDRMLTRLICDEADRIVTLVDRMEVFGDERPVVRGPVNIHSVLDHVKRGWRSRALPATSASSRITIPRCRRCWRTRTSSSRCSSIW